MDPVEGPAPGESTAFGSTEVTGAGMAAEAEAEAGGAPEVAWGLRGGETPVVTAKGRRPPFRLISPAPNAADFE